MIPVLRYEEDCYGRDSKDFDSITNMPLEQLPNDMKHAIVDYLLNADFRDRRVYFLGPRIDDAFGNGQLKARRKSFSDGKWQWFDDLPCYLARYDIQLPKEFVEDVLSFYDGGGTVTPIVRYDDLL